MVLITVAVCVMLTTISRLCSAADGVFSVRHYGAAGDGKKVDTVAINKAVKTVKPVSFADVRVDEGLWAKRLEISRTVTIPECFERCEETGRIDNFAVAAGLKEGQFQGAHYNDSDVYKIVQGAVYSLKVHPDPKLETYLDGVIARIAAAQEPDGYLDTYFMGERKKIRFKNISPGPRHELYCMGHMIEASVEHYRMTGKRTMLDVAVKLADHVDSIFGPGKRDAVPHHQEIESALIKLYRATKERRYLRLAQFFIDRRGHFEDRPTVTFYGQDHLPVREQSEIVGHAVRGMYHCVNIAYLSTHQLRVWPAWPALVLPTRWGRVLRLGLIGFVLGLFWHFIGFNWLCIGFDWVCIGFVFLDCEIIFFSVILCYK